MSLKERLMKNSKVAKTTDLAKSDVFKDKDFAMTAVYALNIAYSGSLFGGVSYGLTFFAAPSKHFKTLYTLMSVKAYMDKHQDAICIFYDTEGGTPKAYFEALGIDIDRVIYTPIKNVEQLKFDLPNQLDTIVEGEKVIIAIDSLGNLASKKEVQDALDENAKADMSRAKEMKSLTRIITPELRDKKIPCIAIGHVYQELGMFPKTIMSGGTGQIYSADQIFFVGKSQEKEGSEVVGYTFTLNVEKSRHVKEKSKIKIVVKYDGGIDKYTGLLDIAVETGHVIKPSNGWYTRVIDGVKEERKWRAKDTSTPEFWDDLINDPTFDEEIGKIFKVANAKLFESNPEDMDDEELLEHIDG